MFTIDACKCKQYEHVPFSYHQTEHNLGKTIFSQQIQNNKTLTQIPAFHKQWAHA